MPTERFRRRSLMQDSSGGGHRHDQAVPVEAVMQMMADSNAMLADIVRKQGDGGDGDGGSTTTARVWGVLMPQLVRLLILAVTALGAWMFTQEMRNVSKGRDIAELTRSVESLAETVSKLPPFRLTKQVDDLENSHHQLREWLIRAHPDLSPPGGG